jgi:cell division protein FtsW
MVQKLNNLTQQIITPFTNAGRGVLRNTRGDLGLWAIVIFLSLLSLLAVYSSTQALAYKKNNGSTEFFLVKQGAFLIAGLVIMYLAHLVHYKWYAYVAKWLFYFSIPLLVYTLFFGSRINDGSRWVSIMGITIQSSDVAKLGLFMYLSLQLSKKQEVIKDFKKGFLPLIIPIAITCLLIIPANLSTGLLLGASALLLIFIGRANPKHILYTIGIAAIPVVMLFALASYTYKNKDSALVQKMNSVARLSTWVKRVQHHFFANENEVPFQVQQSNIAIAKGGFLRLAPGKSEQKNFLPNPFSDFIFSIIIEEYGLFGALVLIGVYLLLLYRCMRIVRKCNYAFGSFLVIGLSFMLGISAFANMAVAVNLLPVTGVSLPLISMGGTSLFFTSFALGIILSVSRHMVPQTENNTNNLEKELA